MPISSISASRDSRCFIPAISHVRDELAQRELKTELSRLMVNGSATLSSVRYTQQQANWPNWPGQSLPTRNAHSFPTLGQSQLGLFTIYAPSECGGVNLDDVWRKYLLKISEALHFLIVCSDRLLFAQKSLYAYSCDTQAPMASTASTCPGVSTSCMILIIALLADSTLSVPTNICV